MGSSAARIAFAAAAALCAACGGTKPDECPATFDDGDPCTVDACDPKTGEVTHAPVDADDGDACTKDACDPATGAPVHAPACDDASACTADACAPGGACSHQWLEAGALAILSGDRSGRVSVVALQTEASGGLTLCPDGPDAMANPPTCMLEFDHPNSTLQFQEQGGGAYRASGTVPARLRNLPVRYVPPIGGAITGSIVLAANGACPGSDQQFVPIPTEVSIDVGATTGAPLAIAAAVDEGALGAGLGACGSALVPLLDFARPLAAAEIAARAEALIVQQVEDQLCLRAPDCPGDTSADASGVCRYPSTQCAARGVDPATGTLIIPACAE